MWVSLKHRAKTPNGYSGTSSPRFFPAFGGDCAELPKRLLAFLAFNRQEQDEDAYRSLVRRVVPIGFKDCNPEWLVKSPKVTSLEREYSADEMRNLSYSLDHKEVRSGNKLSST